MREHEKGLRFFFRRGRAVNHFLEQGQRAFGIAVHQPLNREHFQFLVALVRRLYGLAGRLLHFDLQRAGILLPLALGESPLHVRNRSVPPAPAVLRVRLPVECRIRLRAVHVRELLEFRCRLVVAVLIQRFAAFVIQFSQPVDLFLLPIAGLLFTIAFLLLPVARLLFAISLFLLFILRILLILRKTCGLAGNRPEPMRARNRRRQQQGGDCDPCHACLSN